MPELLFSHPELERALDGSRTALRDRPRSRALVSIVEQLEYLSAFRAGENDGASLDRINIGILAVREIEDADLMLANTLYSIQSALDQFLAKRHA